jgi:hypothetical protein
MSKSLVGYSGFVGANLENQVGFDRRYNSKNINEAFLVDHDFVVYSGVRAEKYLANLNGEEDFLLIKEAINNIKKMRPKKLVLISTVDVYKDTVNVDEDSKIDTEGLEPYGRNRYYLEQWIMNNIADYYILRLPGLYGENMKKNFIFDMINIIPSMLKEDKIVQLSEVTPFNICEFYKKQENGFYKLVNVDAKNRRMIKNFFKDCGFNALSFTDSRSVFQFYNLNCLWKHIEMVIKRGIRLLCPITEPVSASELYYSIFGKEFINEFSNKPPYYDIRSVYADVLVGQAGYLKDKKSVLEDIREFVHKSGGC